MSYVKGIVLVLKDNIGGNVGGGKYRGHYWVKRYMKLLNISYFQLNIESLEKNLGIKYNGILKYYVYV